MNTNNINHQGYWDELPSQTQLRGLIENQEWKRIQQQPKKKGRGGNRSLRRFRMACRAKGLTELKIKMLIERHQANKPIQKRKDDASTWNSSHTINVSMDKS
ncbi:unnamed protein product, partial [Rotaria magnacalcarata]